MKTTILPALAAVLLAAACHPHAGPSIAAGRDSVTLNGVTMTSVAASSGTIPGTLPTGAAAGTAIAAFIPPEAPVLLDPSDRPYLERAVIRAHNAPYGTRVEWRNPETGNGGTVVPGPAADSRGGSCLRMDHAVEVRGSGHQAHATACRGADGTWMR
jgi:surface antigen